MSDALRKFRFVTLRRRKAHKGKPSTDTLTQTPRRLMPIFRLFLFQSKVPSDPSMGENQHNNHPLVGEKSHVTVSIKGPHLPLIQKQITLDKLAEYPHGYLENQIKAQLAGLPKIDFVLTTKSRSSSSAPPASGAKRSSTDTYATNDSAKSNITPPGSPPSSPSSSVSSKDTVRSRVLDSSISHDDLVDHGLDLIFVPKEGELDAYWKSAQHDIQEHILTNDALKPVAKRFQALRTYSHTGENVNAQVEGLEKYCHQHNGIFDVGVGLEVRVKPKTDTSKLPLTLEVHGKDNTKAWFPVKYAGAERNAYDRRLQLS